MDDVKNLGMTMDSTDDFQLLIILIKMTKNQRKISSHCHTTTVPTWFLTAIDENEIDNTTC